MHESLKVTTKNSIWCYMYMSVYMYVYVKVCIVYTDKTVVNALAEQ